MTVSKGKLYLTERERGQHLDLPIDLFSPPWQRMPATRPLRSSSPGPASDGSRGIQEVHAGRGTGSGAEHRIGPVRRHAAQRRGDGRLRPDPGRRPRCPRSWSNMPRSPPPTEKNSSRPWSGEDEHGEHQQIFALLRGQYNLDFSRYKPPTVDRRIQRRMEFCHITDPNSYAALLAQEPQELDALYRDLLIGVTEFFRDPRAFSTWRRTAWPPFFGTVGRRTRSGSGPPAAPREKRPIPWPSC